MMTCTSCSHENDSCNRFCGGCGSALASSCPACAHSNPPDDRFCGACGTALAEVMGDETTRDQLLREAQTGYEAIGAPAQAKRLAMTAQ
jgi:hypothetical protein